MIGLSDYAADCDKLRNLKSVAIPSPISGLGQFRIAVGILIGVLSTTGSGFISEKDGCWMLSFL